MGLDRINVSRLKRGSVHNDVDDASPINSRAVSPSSPSLQQQRQQQQQQQHYDKAMMLDSLKPINSGSYDLLDVNAIKRRHTEELNKLLLSQNAELLDTNAALSQHRRRHQQNQHQQNQHQHQSIIKDDIPLITPKSSSQGLLSTADGAFFTSLVAIMINPNLAWIC